MDVKEGHCWRCEAPGTDVVCKLCSKAKYCSIKCLREDVYRHEPQCEMWAPSSCSNPSCTVSENLKECTSCFLSRYCSVTCQRQDWTKHKNLCRQTLETAKENSNKLAITFYTRTASFYRADVPGFTTLECSYYTGNVLAVDMLHLQTNELVDAGDTSEKVLRQDYSILSAGCGNLRNLIYTVTSLPEEFQGKLRVTLNDIDPFIQARNVLFLFMMTHYSCDPDIASKITTIWYSMHLPNDAYKLLMKCLKILCAANDNLLKIMTQNIVDVTEEDFDILCQVWQGWIDVDYKQTNGLSDSLSKQRDDLQFGDDLSNTSSLLTGFIKRLPDHHGKSIESWIYHGDFLPEGDTAKFQPINPTLTCRRDRGANVTNKEIKYCRATLNRLRQCPNDVEFKFGVPLTCMPFVEWDYLQASKFSTDESLLVMYHAYVTNQIREVIAFAKEERLSVRFVVGHCLDLTKWNLLDFIDRLFHSENEDRFDRIFTSNLAEFLGTKTVLDGLKALLKTDNKHAVIVTHYWNWYHHFPLTTVDDEAYSNDGRGQKWFNLACNDTKTLYNFTPSIHYYQEYFNNSAYFIDYLRADLQACQYVSDPNNASHLIDPLLAKPLGLKLECKKLPTFKEVKVCSDGLCMRDFRHELNKVAPWRYKCNARKVNLLPGNSRMLEWYRP